MPEKYLLATVTSASRDIRSAAGTGVEQRGPRLMVASRLSAAFCCG
jgi:hypothetical protein